MVIDYPNYFKEKKKIETSRASYSKSVALMHQTTLTVSLYSISSELRHQVMIYALTLLFHFSTINLLWLLGKFWEGK